MSAVTVAINLIASDGTSVAFSSFTGSLIGTASRLSGLRGLLHDVSPEFAAIGAAALTAGAAFDAFSHLTDSGIEAAATLQDALIRLKFATQDNADEMPVLTAAINDLAIRTRFGSADAAAAFEHLTEMGFNTTQILYGMSDSANKLADGTYHAKEAVNGLGNQALYLGQALGGSATDAAQLLGMTLHIFSGEGLDATDAANQLAAAFFNGIPDVQQLTEAIRNGGATAASLGITFQDFATTLDILSQSGLDANMAATSLNYYLNQLSAPTLKAAKDLADLGLVTVDSGDKMRAFEAKLRGAGAAGATAANQFDGSVTSLKNMYDAGQQLGLIPLDKNFNAWAIESGLMSSAMFDANGNFIGLKGSVQELRDALDGLPPAERLAYIRDIFNIRGGQDARLLTALDNFGTKYDEITGKVQKTNLGDLAKQMLGTFGGAVDALRDTITSALAIAFMPLLGGMSDIIGHVNDLIGKFQSLPPNVQGAVGLFILLTTAALGLATVVLGVITAIAGIVAILGAAEIPLGAVAIGIGSIVAPIIAAGLAVLGWMVAFGNGRDAAKRLSDVVNGLKQHISEIVGIVSGVATAAFLIFGGHIGAASAIMSAIGGPVGVVVRGFLSLFTTMTPVRTIFGWIITAFRSFGPLLSSLGGFFSSIGPAISGVVAWISEFAEWIAIAVTNLPAIIASAGGFSGIMASLGGAISGAASAVGAFLAPLAAVAGVALLVGAIVAGVVMTFVHWWQTSSQFRAILADMWKRIQDLGTLLMGQFKQAWDAIQQQLVKLHPLLSQLQDLWTTIQPVLMIVGGIIIGIVIVAFGLLWGILKGVISALGPLLSGIIGFIGGIIQAVVGVVQIIIGIFQILVGIVKGIFSGDWTTLQDGLAKLWQGVQNLLGGLVSGIVSLIGGLVGAVIGLIGGFIGGIIDFFKHLFETLVGHSIVPDLVKNILNWIGNLVSTFLQFIGDLVMKVITFFLQLEAKVLNAVNRMVQLFLAYVKAWFYEGLALVSGFVDSFLGFIASLPDKVVNTINTLVTKVRNILNDLKNLFLDAAKGMIDNLVNGLTNGIGKVKDTVGNIAGAIGGILHHSVPDEGPLKDDDEWGGHLVDNFTNSMIDRLPHLADAVQKVAGTVRGPLTTPGLATTAAQTGTSGNVVIPINLDGKSIGEYTLNLATKELRKAGSTRYAR